MNRSWYIVTWWPCGSYMVTLRHITKNDPFHATGRGDHSKFNYQVLLCPGLPVANWAKNERLENGDLSCLPVDDVAHHMPTYHNIVTVLNKPSLEKTLYSTHPCAPISWYRWDIIIYMQAKVQPLEKTWCILLLASMNQHPPLLTFSVPRFHEHNKGYPNCSNTPRRSGDPVPAILSLKAPQRFYLCVMQVKLTWIAGSPKINQVVFVVFG